MPCDHLGGPEIIELAEAHLRASRVPSDQWNGLRFRHGENLVGGMWASVVIEVERRGEQWIVTRLDRLSEPIPQSETGLSEVAAASTP
jgi:hypothetical protein